MIGGFLWHDFVDTPKLVVGDVSFEKQTKEPV